MNGIARPLIDWFCTKQRAIDHAHERAAEVDARSIVVETSDFAVEEVIHRAGASVRYSLVA